MMTLSLSDLTAMVNRQGSDACANLRNAYTLEYVALCPSGYTERNGYCYSRSEPVPVYDPNGLSLPTGMYNTLFQVLHTLVSRASHILSGPDLLA